MEFVLIIIVVVIVSVISAAMKKKPKSSGEQDAPVRPTMTDIQRAFMMAAGMPDEEQNPPPRPAAPYGQQPGQYAPSAPPVQPYAVPYIQAQSVNAAPMADLYSGLSDDLGDKPMASRLSNPFAGTQIDSYFMDEEDRDQIPQAVSVSQQTPAGAGISLFEDQRDIVKALIYTEILPRRSGAQRHR